MRENRKHQKVRFLEIFLKPNYKNFQKTKKQIYIHAKKKKENDQMIMKCDETYPRSMVCVVIFGILKYLPHIFCKIQRSFISSAVKFLPNCLEIHWSGNHLKVV